MDAITNPDTTTNTTDKNSEQPQRWRDVLPIHPAANLFPLMSERDPQALRELADDIKTNDLQVPVILWAENPKDAEARKVQLLDGRNRLDAMEMAGIEIIKRGKLDLAECIHSLRDIVVGGDPYEVVISANIHRRHLNAEDKRELIAKVLKAKPETSNNQIAKQVKADDKTVAKVRTELESTSEIPKLEKTKGKDGKERPAHKAVAVTETAALPEPKASRPPTTAEQAQAQIAKAEAEKAKAEAQKARAEAVARMFPAPETKRIPSRSREALIKALGMLASENAAERAEAAAAVERQRARLNMTWEELIVPAEVAEAELGDAA